MDTTIYYVFELQTGDTGAVIPFVYDNRADAEEKYHNIMMYAAKSNLRKHGAILVNEDGFVTKSEVYRYEDMHEPNE